MQAHFDVTGLGLTRAQAAVLAGIAADGVTTAVHLCGQLRLSAEAVSRAVTALVDMGLVTRDRRQRPCPLTLAPGIDEGLQRLRAGIVEHQRRTRKAFDDAAKDLLAARAEAADGPAPLTGLVPSQPVPMALYRDLFPMREAWDEILTADSPIFGSRHWLWQAQARGVSARLLVIGALPRPSIVRGVVRLGHQLRSTEAALPRLMIVDGTRARVEVIARNARRQGWTEDPRHLVLAAQAFETAWEAATPAEVVPPRVRQ